MGEVETNVLKSDDHSLSRIFAGQVLTVINREHLMNLSSHIKLCLTTVTRFNAQNGWRGR